MASTVQSNNADVVLNAVGGEVVAQINGVEVGRVGQGGFGKVLQVVHFDFTSTESIASDTFLDTSIQAIITPSSATSKIRVDVNFQGGNFGGVEGARVRVTRNGTPLVVGDASSLREQALFYVSVPIGISEIGACSGSTIDSPASTSALTYIVQTRGHSAAHPVYINRSEADSDNVSYTRTVSSITLTEIGA